MAVLRNLTTRSTSALLGVGLLLVLIAAACGAEDPTATPPPTATPTATPLPVDGTGPPVAQPTATPRPTPTPGPPYFQGKTIRMVVGWDPGSNSDILARYLAFTLADFIPGEPRIIVSNLPGGAEVGSRNASNFVWVAEPDGTTVYTGVGGGFTDKLTRPEITRYDYEKFAFVGTFERNAGVMWCLEETPFDRLQDAVNNPDGPEFTIGFGSPSAAEVLLNEAFNWPAKTIFGIVASLSGTLTAFDRKDVDCMMNPGGWTAIPSQRPEWFERWPDESYIKPFALYNFPDLDMAPVFENSGLAYPDDLQNVRDFMTDQQRSDYDTLSRSGDLFSRGHYLPPGTPDETRDIISDAFAAALQDAEWLEGVKKLIGGRPILPWTSGAEMDALAAEVDIRAIDEILRKYEPNYTSPFN